MAELALGIVGAIPVAVSLWPIRTIIGRVHRFLDDGHTLEDLTRQSDELFKLVCEFHDNFDDKVAQFQHRVEDLRSACSKEAHHARRRRLKRVICFWKPDKVEKLKEEYQELRDTAPLYLHLGPREGEVSQIRRTINPAELYYIQRFERREDMYEARHSHARLVVKRVKNLSYTSALDIVRECSTDLPQPHLRQYYGHFYDPRISTLELMFRHPGRRAQEVFLDFDPPMAAQQLLRMTALLAGTLEETDLISNCINYKNANIYLKKDLNPVLADFDEVQEQKDHTSHAQVDGFLTLINKMILDQYNKPNYTVSEQKTAQARKFGHALRFLVHYLFSLPFDVPRGQTPIEWIQRTTNRLEQELGVYSGSHLKGTVQDFLMANPIHQDLCAFWDMPNNVILDVLPGDIGIMCGSSEHPVFQRIDNWSHVLYPQDDTIVKPAPDSTRVRYHNSDGQSVSYVAEGYIRHTMTIPTPHKFPYSFGMSRGHHYSSVGPGGEPDWPLAWSFLEEHREQISLNAKEYGVQVSDIIFVCSNSQKHGYALINIISEEGLARLLDLAGVSRQIYYFERISAEQGDAKTGVKGYWSFSEDPGNPKWPQDYEYAPGPEWAWVHEEDGLYFEIGRKDAEQHIRYIALSD